MLNYSMSGFCEEKKVSVGLSFGEGEGRRVLKREKEEHNTIVLIYYNYKKTN